MKIILYYTFIILLIIFLLYKFNIKFSLNFNKIKNKYIDLNDILYYKALNEINKNDSNNKKNEETNNMSKSNNIDLNDYILNNLDSNFSKNLINVYTPLFNINELIVKNKYQEEIELINEINNNIKIINDYLDEEEKIKNIDNNDVDNGDNGDITNDTIITIDNTLNDNNLNNNTLNDELDDNVLIQLNNLNQNVHDSLVQNKTKDNYNLLTTDNSNNSNNLDNNIISIEIISFANSNLYNQKLELFNKTIEEISLRNSIIMNLNNKTEIEVINDVWNSIDKNLNDDEIYDKKMYFINSILDCVENDMLVCPSGVTVRVINYDLSKNNLISKDLLRVEMMNTASNLMQNLTEDEEFLNKSSSTQKKIFKSKLIEIFKKDYKNLDFEIVKKEYESWIDHI